MVNSTDGVGHVELEKLEVRDIPNDEIELSIEGLQNYDEEQGLIFNRWTLKYEVFSKIFKNFQNFMSGYITTSISIKLFGCIRLSCTWDKILRFLSRQNTPIQKGIIISILTCIKMTEQNDSARGRKQICLT